MTDDAQPETLECCICQFKVAQTVPHRWRRSKRRCWRSGARSGEAQRPITRAKAAFLAIGGRSTDRVPALLRVGGYRFFFYSLENREPPHIHVAHAGRYAKFWLDPVTLASNRGFRSYELTTIRQLVEEHREFFLEKWNACFSGNR